MVPISADLDRQITDLIGRVRTGEPLDDDAGWEGVVCSMAEAAIALASGERSLPCCGLPLLRAFGVLSQVLQETQSVRLPPHVAIALLVEYQRLPLLLDWSAGSNRIVTTAAGVARLGGRANYAVPVAPHHALGPEFFRWHLDRASDEADRGLFEAA